MGMFVVDVVVVLWLFLAGVVLVESDCSVLNNCNGNGVCDPATSTCLCFPGYGAATDVTYYRAPDCSARTCPSDRAWADVPVSNGIAHKLAECSNRGACNRDTGECSCFPGFTGAACQRSVCPNDCSGHGTCVSMKQMARMTNALPLSPATFYEGDIDGKTWDEDKIYGCVCESSWSVGLGAGQTQEPEWFGPDCSLRHCPSGDDPRTAVVETNCYNVTAANSVYVGAVGNLCQVDCSNRGLCNYDTGLCQCFNGYYGENCASIDPQKVYTMWNN